MPLISRQAAKAFLVEQGLRAVDEYVFMGFQNIGGRTFPFFAGLRPNFVQVVVHLGLFTSCNQPQIYRYFNRVNASVVLGKFTIGPRGNDGQYPLLLEAEVPTGSEESYTSEETLMVLFKFGFDLVAQHYNQIERLFQQGCRAEAEEQEERRGLLDRLRLFREERERGS